jgi:hypothetical protein
VFYTAQGSARYFPNRLLAVPHKEEASVKEVLERFPTVLAFMSFPKDPPPKDPLDQPSRASDRRDQATHRRRRHLSQRH